MPIVTLDEMKAHLNVTFGDDDDLISGKIAAAEGYLEGITNKAFLTQTLSATFNRFTWPLKLPRGPVQEVTAITYLDAEWNEQTLDPAAFHVSQLNSDNPALIYPVRNTCWPATARIEGSVTVSYTAGYGDDATDVPAPLREATRLLAANWYANREAALVGINGVIPMELPYGVAELIAGYRTWVFF